MKYTYYKVIQQNWGNAWDDVDEEKYLKDEEELHWWLTGEVFTYYI